MKVKLFISIIILSFLLCVQLFAQNKKSTTKPAAVPRTQREPAPPAPAPTSITTADIIFPAEVTVNSTLRHYEWRDGEYYLLIPNNINSYTYLSHYPLTAFIFVNNYSEDKINNLTIKQLRSGSFYEYGSYYILSFDKIKGFEDAAKELETLDEFGASAKKSEFIKKLIECYRNSAVSG